MMLRLRFFAECSARSSSPIALRRCWAGSADAEFFGGLGLISRFLTGIAAFGVFANMIVAISMVHHQFGFFMNWTGAQKGEGYEYHLLVLAIMVFLMIRGAGAFSVDRLLSTAQVKAA